jgi:hypothetical protein
VSIHPILFNASFRYTLIEYSKPFKNSKGLVKYRNSISANDFVPEKYRNLHNRIIDARDQFHAHCDISILDPQLHFTNNDDETSAVIIKNIIHGTQEYKNSYHLIELINMSLDLMDIELIRLKTKIEEKNKN